MNASELSVLSGKLVHAATAYDRRQEGKLGYNVYALPQYFRRIDDVVADVRNGAKPREALIAGFTDRLRDALLKAIGEPKATRDEADQGLVYVPISDRK